MQFLRVGVSTPVRVLVACEMSGRVRDSFIRNGVDAVSCDILPSMSSYGPHIQTDVLNVIEDGWDILIAFPPCTYLANVGARWWPFRQEEQQQAIEFSRSLWSAPISKICIENPVGRMSLALGPATQYVNPWMFGDPYTKKTGLWLKNLPPLIPTIKTKPQGVTSWVGGRYGNVIDSGKAKKSERSLTFPGIAEAMANSWG